jgi:TPR repeat protein
VARSYRRQHMCSNIPRRIIIRLLTLNFIVCSNFAFAGPFEDSMAAYDRGDYATAIRLCRPLAEQGNAKAQNGLGAMYYHGHGVARDFKEAVKWYRLAASQGNADAQLNLGAMYYDGEGVTEDLMHAHMWLNIAATQSNSDAIKYRDVVSKQMTKDQLTEAQAMALKCTTSNYMQCD